MTTQVLEPVRLRTHVFKGCRRCGGDLRLERDADIMVRHNAYDYVCLQCGRHTPLAAVLGRRWDTDTVEAA